MMILSTAFVRRLYKSLGSLACMEKAASGFLKLSQSLRHRCPLAPERKSVFKPKPHIHYDQDKMTRNTHNAVLWGAVFVIQSFIKQH